MASSPLAAGRRLEKVDDKDRSRLWTCFFAPNPSNREKILALSCSVFYSHHSDQTLPANSASYAQMIIEGMQNLRGDMVSRCPTPTLYQ